MNDAERRPEDSLVTLPDGMDAATLEGIEKSFVVREAKKRMGIAFVDIALGDVSAEEKTAAFKRRAVDELENARHFVEKNPAIPGGRTDEALRYILHKAVMEAVERHGLDGVPADQAVIKDAEVDAIDGKRVEAKPGRTGVEKVPAGNDIDAGLTELFNRFHPPSSAASRRM